MALIPCRHNVFSLRNLHSMKHFSCALGFKYETSLASINPILNYVLRFSVRKLISGPFFPIVATHRFSEFGNKKINTEMKRCKIVVFVKDLSIRSRRDVNEGHFHYTTTVILSLWMLIFVFILGLFLHDNVKKLLTSEDSSSAYSPHCQRNFPSSSDLLPFSFSNGRTNPSGWKSPEELWHSMSDKELLWRASMMPQVLECPYNRTPKVAFMFLTRGRLPLAPLWERFFKGSEGLYSIYVHTSPEFTYEPPESSVFYKRRIPSKVRT